MKNKLERYLIGVDFMEEYVEVLLQDGTNTKEKITKSKAHEDGICHGISAIAFINEKGEVLLQKRSSNKSHRT